MIDKRKVPPYLIWSDLIQGASVIETSQKGTKSFPTPQALEEPTLCYLSHCPPLPHSKAKICVLSGLSDKKSCCPMLSNSILRGLACLLGAESHHHHHSSPAERKEGRKEDLCKTRKWAKNIPVSKRLLYRDKCRHSRSRVGPQHHSIRYTSQVDTVRYHGINLEIEP